MDGGGSLGVTGVQPTCQTEKSGNQPTLGLSQGPSPPKTGSTNSQQGNMSYSKGRMFLEGGR